MINFTTLFLENLIGNSFMSLNTSGILGSLIPTSTSISATELSDAGSQLMDDYDSSLLNTTGSISTSVGTSISLNGMDVYQDTLKQLETTQAYIESLDEQELGDLLSKLEVKENELSKKDPVQKTKKL